MNVLRNWVSERAAARPSGSGKEGSRGPPPGDLVEDGEIAIEHIGHAADSSASASVSSAYPQPPSTRAGKGVWVRPLASGGTGPARGSEEDPTTAQQRSQADRLSVETARPSLDTAIDGLRAEAVMRTLRPSSLEIVGAMGCRALAPSTTIPQSKTDGTNSASADAPSGDRGAAPDVNGEADNRWAENQRLQRMVQAMMYELSCSLQPPAGQLQRALERLSIEMDLCFAQVSACKGDVQQVLVTAGGAAAALQLQPNWRDGQDDRRLLQNLEAPQPVQEQPSVLELLRCDTNSNQCRYVSYPGLQMPPKEWRVLLAQNVSWLLALPIRHYDASWVGMLTVGAFTPPEDMIRRLPSLEVAATCISTTWRGWQPISDSLAFLERIQHLEDHEDVLHDLLSTAPRCLGLLPSIVTCQVALLMDSKSAVVFGTKGIPAPHPTGPVVSQCGEGQRISLGDLVSNRTPSTDNPPFPLLSQGGLSWYQDRELGGLGIDVVGTPPSGSKLVACELPVDGTVLKEVMCAGEAHVLRSADAALAEFPRLRHEILLSRASGGGSSRSGEQDCSVLVLPLKTTHPLRRGAARDAAAQPSLHASGANSSSSASASLEEGAAAVRQDVLWGALYISSPFLQLPSNAFIVSASQMVKAISTPLHTALCSISNPKAWMQAVLTSQGRKAGAKLVDLSGPGMTGMGLSTASVSSMDSQDSLMHATSSTWMSLWDNMPSSSAAADSSMHLLPAPVARAAQLPVPSSPGSVSSVSTAARPESSYVPASAAKRLQQDPSRRAIIADTTKLWSMSRANTRLFRCMPPACAHHLTDYYKALLGKRIQNESPMDRLSGLKIGSLLGRGGGGLVFEGRLYGEDVAVKILMHSDDGSRSIQKVSRVALEVAATSQIRHPCIVQTDTRHGRSQAQPLAALASPGAASLQDEDDSAVRRSQEESQAVKAYYLDVPINPQGSNTEVEKMAQEAAQKSKGPSGGVVLGLTASFLVMELLDGGSLVSAIERKLFLMRDPASGRRSLYPNMPMVMAVLTDIVSAIHHIHTLGIIHSDMKADNVLMLRCNSSPAGFRCKLTDFGFARVLVGSERIEGDSAGTPVYMAPESFDRGNGNPIVKTRAVDIYALGFMMWELVHGEVMFSREPDIKATLTEVVFKSYRPPVSRKVPAQYVQLMCSCWAQDPHNRPTAAQLLQEIRSLAPSFSRPAGQPGHSAGVPSWEGAA